MGNKHYPGCTTCFVDVASTGTPYLLHDNISSLMKNIDIYNNHIGPGFNPQTNDAVLRLFLLI